MNPMFISRLRCVFVFCALGAWCGCGSGREETDSVESRPDPLTLELTDPKLVEGRAIWMETCTDCHLRGVGGAPKIGDVEAWAPRIAKGAEALYENAINGFTGPTYDEMPPKGGFEDLSDDEVRRAVDFVVHVSQ